MKKIISNFLVIVCIISLAVLSVSVMASAKGITSAAQAKTKALQKVPGAHVTEVESDYEKGKQVYEVKLYKGTKEYELTYRASDGKLIAYGWEEEPVRSSKALLSKAACKKLAKKKVPGATVLWVERDDDDGIEIYEVEMKKGSVKYELTYHGRTGKLLEYKWEK